MILFRCKCGKVMKTQPSHAGKGIRCPDCMSIIRVPESAPVKAALVNEQSTSQASSSLTSPKIPPRTSAQMKAPRDVLDYDEPDELEDSDDLDLDYAEESFSDDVWTDYDEEPVDAVAEELPDYESSLPARRKKKKPKPVYEEKKKAPPTPDESVSPKVMNALYGLAGVFVAGLLGLIGYSIMSAGSANAEFYELPTEFEKWRHGEKNLSCEVPSMSCWELKESGGTAGKAPKLTIRNDFQNVRITVHGSLSGTAMAMVAKSGGGLQVKDDEEVPEDLTTIGAMHRYQLMKIESEYNTYEETAPEKIDTGFGDARVSEFKAKSALASEFGLRATVISSEFLYNVLCKCPKDRVEEYKPIFMRMIKSIGR